MTELSARVQALSKEAPSASAASSSTADQVREVQEGVAALKTEIADMRNGQSAAFKKERSITEAVLGQKLERSAGERAQSAARAAEEAASSVKQLTKKVEAVSTAVDNQARFVNDLVARIDHTIAAAVEEAVENMRGEDPEKAEAPSDETNALDQLEASPKLDGDQIDLVSKAAAPKKGRGGTRKKT